MFNIPIILAYLQPLIFFFCATLVMVVFLASFNPVVFSRIPIEFHKERFLGNVVKAGVEL